MSALKKPLSQLFLLIFLLGCTSAGNPRDDFSSELFISNGSTYLLINDAHGIDLTGFELDSLYVLRDSEDQLTYADFTYYVQDLGYFEVKVEVKGYLFEHNSLDPNVPSEIQSTPVVLSVSHEQLPGYEIVTGESFEDGHAWVVPGASTLVQISSEFAGDPEDEFPAYSINYQIRCEYDPYISNIDEAEAKYEANVEEILEISNRFISFQ